MAWLEVLEAYAAASLNDAVHLLNRRFPEILWEGDPASDQVALTFDDGPHPRDTPALLEVLAKHSVPATFSWLGERVEAHPELVGAAARAGHQLMIHGYRHRSFLLEPQGSLRTMLDRTRDLLAHHSGRDPSSITYVRPPFGHFSASILRGLCAWGYQPVLCSIMPVHWMLPAEVSVRHAVAQIEGGSLVVLHESLAGSPVAKLTDAILTRLAGRGLTFVSLDTLRAGRDAAKTP
ncbi:MAG: polysaccharide deacetylase family protein [Chloroflexales bacterium]|nr:polysaccharide deacetylase family protein [Chloroflexales bacterium]